jgi:hypothetical protein
MLRQELRNEAIERVRIHAVHPMRGIWNSHSLSLLEAGLDYSENLPVSRWTLFTADK